MTAEVVVYAVQSRAATARTLLSSACAAVGASAQLVLHMHRRANRGSERARGRDHLRLVLNPVDGAHTAWVLLGAGSAS